MGGPGTVALLRTADGARVLAADLHTAVLFEALQAPGGLARVGDQLPEPERELLAARLVWDGVLEVDRGDGAFVHGPAARELVPPLGRGPREAPPGALDALARGALVHAARNPGRPELGLVRRLYMFNAAPRTAAWCEDVARAGGVEAWLGVGSRVPWSRGLARHYALAAGDQWLAWVRGDARRGPAPRHKLYVSPAPGALRDAFARTVEVCVAGGVPSLKVASTAPALLRPDRLVLHLESEDRVWSVAGELRAALRGVEAQGVPFTAPIDGEGLLSWAIDPPEREAAGAAGRPRSWRMAVALVLARAVAAARDALAEDAQVAFALDRLRLEGIEPLGWRPPEAWR